MSDEPTLHALPAGHVLDGYRLLRMLGAGGFGITYLAEEVQIGRKVAIKEFLPTGFAAREANSFSVRPLSAGAAAQFKWGLERFRQEAATLVNFEHPNIVAVHRYFEANGTAYLVMQYVEGKPLDAILAGSKTLAESEIEEVIGPILDGLDQVHAARFLHRDIKPANIYIRRDGRPVLLDFGAARQAFGSETKSITAIVSEGYAPFEQYEAKGDQGPWTDVYALGAVLYRCIAGQRPPAAPERISARLRGAPDPMPPARAAAQESYSQRLLEAIDRSLALMPAERPQSIAALRDALKAAARDGGSSRMASTLGERAAAPAVAPVAPSVPVAPVSGPATVRAKSRVPMFAGLAALVLAGAAAAYFALAPGKPPATDQASRTIPPAAADEAAERVAAAAAEDAAAIVDSASKALEKGELERARDELRLARRRVEDALARRRGHAALERVLGAVSVAEGDLGRRVTARVKELTDAAERDTDSAAADKRLDEAERLDPTAASAARDKIKRAREERARSEAEKSREHEARAAKEKESEVHLSLAQYHLGQARDAMNRNRMAEARQLARESNAQLAKATDAAKAALAPGKSFELPTTFKIMRGSIDDFERDLARRIADRVIALLREARAAIAANRADDAAKALDEAAELEPASADVTTLRRDLEAAKKRAEDARKADDARRADEARKADDARKADETRKADDARRADAERRRKEEEARKRTDPPANPAGTGLAGRTGSLSRLSAERRAIMRMRLQFGAGGALAASCSVETAAGGQEPCFGQQSGGGRWSLNGTTLCLSAAVINLPANTCYQMSGLTGQVTLSGPGILAGAMFLQ